ncbi:RNA-binding ATPase activator esf2 [Modicella reniformis]|uniref:18S rRNA factor 2 n=1 Tax=Modicella reniformis TaxID=1440133 RepID=A0A9P6INI5_9FUNG|nr:RNA-binding ATPase activator esf2 [Modicella reniformis]
MSSKLKTDDIFNLENHSDVSSYDSEEERGHKTAATTSLSIKNPKAAPKRSKRKKAAVFGLDYGGDSDDDDDDDEDHDNWPQEETESGNSGTISDPRFMMEDDGKDETKIPRIRGTKKSNKVKPLTPEALEKFQAARDKTGIVYLSRIPPFMKPIKIRHLLGKFGEIGRVYLAPEDPKIATRRKKYGGNKKQNYTEGWVEFLDKSVAKQVAKVLNATIIGGKKNSHYHDDIWNIKYLPKFKWDHLTERIAYENASRAQRLQTEISQAKRENKFILSNMEKSKMIKSIEEKKFAKRKGAEDDGASGDIAVSDSSNAKIRRAFKQRRLDSDGEPSTKASAPVQAKIKSVLGNVFGRSRG